MSALTEFLFPAPAQRSVKSIVGWWEKRRLPYNLIVGAAGSASLAWVYLAETIMRGEIPPGPPLVGVVIFGVLANVCYTLGPTIEVLVEKIWGRDLLPVGPVLYRMGLTFSVGLALLPGMIMTISMIVRTIMAVFGG